ncbi:MAG: hypothetical protein IRY99_21410, partial [Isosphaeraceae bacterium]|nr:hypothetical protein [Isosphaeraceae bacterium]
MVSPRERSPSRRLALWAGLAVGWVLPSVGCQVEYAGMTLPSGKYMYDDVQYFPPGPDFPWANTQAATQRARMRAAGIDIGGPAAGPAITPPPAGGALAPTQNIPFRPTNVNESPATVEPIVPPGAAPGAVPAPPAGAPA